MLSARLQPKLTSILRAQYSTTRLLISSVAHATQNHAVDHHSHEHVHFPRFKTFKHLSDVGNHYAHDGLSEAQLQAVVYEKLLELEEKVLARNAAFNKLYPKSLPKELSSALINASTDMIFLSSLLCTIIFCIFLYLQYIEFAYEMPFSFQDSMFGSGFYSLLGLHGSHVVIGAGMLALLTWKAFWQQLHPSSTYVKCTSMYVHLVDIVFIVLFFVIYCARVDNDLVNSQKNSTFTHPTEAVVDALGKVQRIEA
eukprot:NODE_6120_length_923_cov_70.106250_g5529_i0.p1 GENE.NODE_6120_length_923_cov_70.106250_g5529_i0~~NODE_6120_length_923_cov_70.106250_g5529_i0.p1  ORF type:complete len:254 (-),score=20.51 NODE_6120_length_923_cov_70.106250_g5529_i0:104-865(-)